MADRPDRSTLLLALVVIAALGIGFAVGSHVLWTASEDTTFNATDGPAITLGEDAELTSHDPFPTNDTVALGNINLTSNGQTSATITSIPGTETTLSNIQTNGRVLYADHDQAQRIGVDGLDEITWQQVDLSADQTEIVTSGAGTLYVDGFNADQSLRVMRNGNAELHQANSTGVLTLSVNNDNLNIRNASAPAVSDVRPVNEEPVDQTAVTLQADIFDDDFPADTHTVEWYLNGNKINTETINDATTVSYDTSAYTKGLNEWTLNVTDSQGVSVNATGSFRTPTELELRNESSPSNLVTASANVTFFFDSGDTVESRTTTNGKIDMDGLPINESFTVQVEANGYITRESYVSSAVERQRIYLLPDNATTSSIRFTISDPTGQFEQEDTRVFVDRPIERGGSTEYETVAADIIGSGTWTTQLEDGVRYQIRVRDVETGDEREMGPFVPSGDEFVELKIDRFDFDFSDGVSADVPFDIKTEYVNDTGPGVNVAFGADGTIDELNVKIYLRNNESVEILNETVYNRGDTVQLRGVVPSYVDNPDTKTWVVEYEGQVNGEDVSGSELAGQGQLPQDVPGVGSTILAASGMLVIFVVAGLFSQANVGIGAITTSIVAGAMWFVGVIPAAVSGIGIAIALMIGVLYHVKDPTQTPR